MEFKDIIVVLYEKALCENMAIALKNQLAGNYPDKYIIAVHDDQFIKNDFAKLRRKMHKSFVRAVPKSELFFSEVSHFSVKLRLKKQRRSLKKDLAPTHSGKSGKLFGRHLKYVQNIFLRYDPEMVICLTPYSLNMAMATKSLINANTIVTAFVPEVCLDEKFVDYCCDGYYVLNAEVRASLMKLGISESHIIVSGYPPCPELADKAAISQKLKLDTSFPTVLLSGGEYEKQHLFPYFQALTDTCTQYNLIIDAKGINAKKLKKACELCAAREHVFIIEDATFVELLSVCDILVTTPETDKLFMAFGFGKPSILTPAQTLFQRKIVNYMSEREVVVLTDTPEQFSKSLLDKIEELDDMKQMADRAADLMFPDGAPYRLNAPASQSNLLEITD